jgi:hypothetical protein
LLDSDFLSVLSENEEAFAGFVSLTPKSYLVVDPFTRFEFLQTVFLKARRGALEAFLNLPYFVIAESHQVVLMPILENALKLSWIYAHQKCTSASPIDRIMASRAIYQKCLIITGNRRDFPGCAFKLVGVINFEKNNPAQVQAFSVLEYDQVAYKRAVTDWKAIGE